MRLLKLLQITEATVLDEGILDALPPGARQLGLALGMMSILSGAQGHESNVEHPPKHPDFHRSESFADRLNSIADVIATDNSNRYGQWVANLYDTYMQNPEAFKRMFGIDYEKFMAQARQLSAPKMAQYMKDVAHSFHPGEITEAPGDFNEARNPKVKVKYMSRNEAYYAYLGRTRVGQAQLNAYNGDRVAKDERYIWKSAVHPDYLRQGVATELYNVIADDLAKRGLKLVPSPDTQLSDEAYAFWKARDPESIKNHGRTLAEPYQKYVGQQVEYHDRPTAILKAHVSDSGKVFFRGRYADAEKGSVNSEPTMYLDAIKDQLGANVK